MSTYKTTVGIEIHVELKTESKMFCGCKNAPHESSPNTNICPVCLAHPGTLPTVNKDAVAKVLLVGAAIGANNADFSEFDRKNYFYPDIPKAYQISQYAHPLVKGGEIAGVAITRIHLEEDTARSQHDEVTDASLVDFNRAGVPLMELVTEPVIHSAEEAGNFGRELQLLLRTLKVSDANMERGEMRVEANISVSNSGQFGTKVEVKNLNSFRAMEAAINFETKRQIALIEAGEKVVQETRGWNEQKLVTFSQRSKESANDYRYFPDPDIPKYALSSLPEFSNSRLSEIMPILPSELRRDLVNLGLSEQKITILMDSEQLRNFFLNFSMQVAGDTAKVKLGANYITTDLIALLTQDDFSIHDDSVSCFAELMLLLSENEINSRAAKDMLPKVVSEACSPRLLAEELGLFQKSSTEELTAIATVIIADNPAVADEYRGGKEASLQFFIGQGMKATKGAANPAILADVFKKLLQ